MPKKPQPKPPGTYHLHRQRQRRRILAAAEQLFDQRGIDRTTMAEIIAVTGLRASTLYEYFSNKDDIVWAVLSQTLQHSADSIQQTINSATTGLAKITILLDHMADQLANHQANVRFMAQFDAMYARDWPVERLLTLEGQLNQQGFQVFESLIREGIADGSLRPDLHPELTLHAVFNAVVGAQRRLASLGTKVETEYGQPVSRLFQEMTRIVLLGLAAPAKPRKSPSKKPAKKLLSPPAKSRKSTNRKRTS
jgi:AcrR family transcriptional regulator